MPLSLFLPAHATTSHNSCMCIRLHANHPLHRDLKREFAAIPRTPYPFLITSLLARSSVAFPPPHLFSRARTRGRPKEWGEGREKRKISVVFEHGVVSVAQPCWRRPGGSWRVNEIETDRQTEKSGVKKNKGELEEGRDEETVHRSESCQNVQQQAHTQIIYVTNWNIKKSIRPCASSVLSFVASARARKVEALAISTAAAAAAAGVPTGVPAAGECEDEFWGWHCCARAMYTQASAVKSVGKKISAAPSGTRYVSASATTVLLEKEEEEDHEEDEDDEGRNLRDTTGALGTRASKGTSLLLVSLVNPNSTLAAVVAPGDDEAGSADAANAPAPPTKDAPIRNCSSCCWCWESSRTATPPPSPQPRPGAVVGWTLLLPPVPPMVLLILLRPPRRRL